MAKLSVIIITKDEAENIGDCLYSVRWADEKIVVDSGSQDETTTIARAHGATVIETDWPGYGPQKNRALDAASGEWVLSLDADEVVTDALRDEMMSIISGESACAAYAMPRRSLYCGRLIKFGDWRRDKVLRLFRRDQGRFTDDVVHERLEVTGAVGRCHHHLLHETFKDLEAVLVKVNEYSSLTAQQHHQRGKRASLPKALGRALWTFVRGYVLRAGFLDGREGLMLAISNAEGTYYRYAKLMLLLEEHAE